MKSKTSSASKEQKSNTKVDPALRKQVERVAADEEPVNAVLMLRPDKASQVSASPDRAEELAHRALQRVEKRVGIPPSEVNVFRNLGVFAVTAKPEFMRELLKQPEVASAMAHDEKPKALIPPRDVAPVEPGSTRGWAAPKPEKKTRSKTARPQASKTSKPSGKSSRGKSKK